MDKEKFYQLCQEGKLEEIREVIKHKEYDWNQGLLYACCGTHDPYFRDDDLHIEIIKLFVSKGAHEFNYCLGIACERGLEKIINLMISLGADNWNAGMCRACFGNYRVLYPVMIDVYIRIAHLMISKGANDWNEALEHSCMSGNIELTELMVKNGARDWNKGLQSAFYGKVQSLVYLSNSSETNDQKEELSFKINKKYMEISLLMIKNGANNIANVYYTYDRSKEEIMYLLENGINIKKLSEIKGIEELEKEMKNYKDEFNGMMKEIRMLNELTGIMCQYMVL